ncbi:MAG: hypothetical protein E7521_09240 [Ruminococcaceae bacterium]|nr:hypothetical protein [Oscillospiraceae bacterium]
MKKLKLCPHCKTGKQTLSLDKSSFICPYINCHDGKTCTKFERLDTHKKPSRLRKLFKLNKEI